MSAARDNARNLVLEGFLLIPIIVYHLYYLVRLLFDRLNLLCENFTLRLIVIIIVGTGTHSPRSGEATGRDARTNVARLVVNAQGRGGGLSPFR